LRALKDILFKVPAEIRSGSEDKMVACLQVDSRRVVQDCLFAAVRGTQADGHSFISKAIEAGASVIVCEEMPAQTDPHVTYVVVKDAGHSLALMACNFYEQPSKAIKLVGVTGTNGKTTVATLLYNLFKELGYSAGLISTVQNCIDDAVIPSTHTTPDAISLNSLLDEMVQVGCSHVFMEVSSHAIHQHRIAGLHFEGGIFTNLTHDHLDYHKTFEDYLTAKKTFFDKLDRNAFALTNKDDKNGMVMLQNTKATKYTYSMHALSDFKARIIEKDFTGMLLDMEGDEVWFNLIGKFNTYNLLAVYATAFLLGHRKEEILTSLSKLRSVTGRFDFIVSPRSKIVGIVDYAHTPDALKNILGTIGEIRSGNEQVITVVGCGGDRDRTKRPIMAEVTANLSDKVILTSDNPRSENPESIIEEMQKGISALNYKKSLRITDRKEAIKAAVSMANAGDIILVAGKGHEKYQEIAGVKHAFDDKEILREMFGLLEK
jgi:UDP-N-acetylmuramoyl-L-alanyl-D-glutamate--2,6-diaminopimelate ligase